MNVITKEISEDQKVCKYKGSDSIYSTFWLTVSCEVIREIKDGS